MMHGSRRPMGGDFFGSGEPMGSDFLKPRTPIGDEPYGGFFGPHTPPSHHHHRHHNPLPPERHYHSGCLGPILVVLGSGIFFFVLIASLIGSLIG